MDIRKNLEKIREGLPSNVTLIAVSKTKPIQALQEAYEANQLHFGENKVQELCEKASSLPENIKWHMIGHLQTNKVKYIAPFVYLIHGVDSFKLLKEIDKRANQNNRVINCLIQMHIAQEESKFGFSEEEVVSMLNKDEYKVLKNIKVVGLMGMATNTENEKQIKLEFETLNKFYQKLKPNCPEFNTLSMGMSGDYKLAIEKGSTMIRVGSAIFGTRNYNSSL